MRGDAEGRVLKSTVDCPVCKTRFKPVLSKGGSMKNMYTHKTLTPNCTARLHLTSQTDRSLKLKSRDSSHIKQPTLGIAHCMHLIECSQAQELDRSNDGTDTTAILFVCVCHLACRQKEYLVDLQSFSFPYATRHLDKLVFLSANMKWIITHNSVL